MGADTDQRSTMTSSPPGSTMPNIPQAVGQHSQTEDGSPCMFWKLPLEIRDMIYGLVYGEERVVKVMARLSWQDNKELGTTNFSETFPESVLSTMLVSKQYLDEAIRVYAKTKTFRFPRCEDFLPALSNGCVVNRHVIRSAHSMIFDAFYAGGILLQELPMLSCLELSVDKYAQGMDVLVKGDSRRYSDLDIVKLPMMEQLFELRGLKKISFTPRTYDWETSPKVSENLTMFCSQAQKLLREVTMKPRAPEHVIRFSKTIHEVLAAGQEERPRLRSVADDPNSRLKAKEIPIDASEFARAFFLRPNALYNCFKDAMDMTKLLRGHDGMPQP